MARNAILIQFINRLSRKPLSSESAEYIYDMVIEDLQKHYGEVFKWVIVGIIATLMYENHNVILLHQEEYPDVKEFIQITRTILLGLGLKIS